MALRIDIKRTTLEHALDMSIASSRRAMNTQRRPEFTEIYKKEIAELLAAKATISEVK